MFKNSQRSKIKTINVQTIQKFKNSSSKTFTDSGRPKFKTLKSPTPLNFEAPTIQASTLLNIRPLSNVAHVDSLGCSRRVSRPLGAAQGLPDPCSVSSASNPGLALHQVATALRAAATHPAASLLQQLASLIAEPQPSSKTTSLNSFVEDPRHALSSLASVRALGPPTLTRWLMMFKLSCVQNCPRFQVQSLTVTLTCVEVQTSFSSVMAVQSSTVKTLQKFKRSKLFA